MSFLTILLYYFMIGSLMGFVAAARVKHKASKWAQYVHDKNENWIYSKEDLTAAYPFFMLATFVLVWPLLLWGFVKIMFNMKLKWEKPNVN